MRSEIYKYWIVPSFIFLKAKKKGKDTWLNLLEMLTDAYWEKKFGPDWKKRYKEFWEKFPDHTF